MTSNHSDETHAVSLKSVVSVAPDQVSTEVGGEVVILSLIKQEYFGLDEVGAFIWHSIHTPTTVADVVAAVLRNYEVDPETCARDVLTLMEHLLQERLVEIHDQG